jgi:integrase
VFLSPFVFHRGDGKAIGDIRKVWAKAATVAGVPGLLFHDLRRSAVRTLVRAGVDRDMARKISGHKTEAGSRATTSPMSATSEPPSQHSTAT